MKKGKIQIKGDGTPWGTKVYCGDVDISENLISLEITKIDKSQCATAIITVINPKLDLTLGKHRVEFKEE